jgi:hypothetical protein
LKILVACLVTAIAVLLGAGTFASAGQQAVTPGQFAALKKRVASLEKSNKVVLAYVGACFNKWAPITDYGAVDGEGYVYTFADGTSRLESAVDVTNTGDQPNFFVPAAPSDCSLNLPRFRSLANSANGARSANLTRVGHSR